MKQGWEIKKLGELCDVIGGGTPSKKNIKFYEGNILWATVRDMKSEIISKTEFKITEEAVKKSSTNIIPKGNVIIATRVGLGKVCFLESDTAINQDLRGIIPKKSKQLDVGYLFQWFKSISHLIVEEGTGATVQGVKLPFVKELEIPLPPLPEQQRIVSILFEAFAAIAKAKANIEQNLKNSKELFESYLQGVFENGNWEMKTLNQISENLDSKRIPITKNQRKSGDIPYYGASGIVDYVADYIFDEDLLCVSEDGANLLARTYPIAFSISGKTWVNNHAHVLKFSNLITQKFVETYINSIRIDDYVSGMAQPKLNQAMLNKIPIPFPRLKEQQTIVRQLDALRAETQKLEAIYQQKLLNLEELKKSVLQKAFNGEL
jgi:type I restriction enzyme S subunit